MATKQHMRKQALDVIELTKGITCRIEDNALKSLLEMTNYVLELTSELENVPEFNPVTTHKHKYE